MKKQDGPSRSWPTPHTTLFFLPPEDPSPVLQVHTMATAEKAASGSDWHIPLWTADGEVLLQGKSRMHIV
jgi:hypothetical protein